ncbi:MAG: DNA cytosine methyltransferase [Verrucomicrobiaceae bacterium]|nr:DNA cytosine methyltransferase [Verrucomicrobiaceae bacterium]
MMSIKPIISLFSGAMGLDLGLESAGHGLQTSVAVEINPIAVETIRRNRPDLPVFNKPIEQVKTSELLKAAKLKAGDAFAVIGGPCCQSFSTVGKRLSLGDDKRGGLFRHFLRIVREAKPRFFVMENVKGVLSAAITHRPLNKRGPGFPPLSADEEFGSALNLICGELGQLGYKVIYSLVNCADYGVPQKRYRVLFVGSRDWEDVRIPEATHFEDAEPRWVTMKQALLSLEDTEPEYLNFTPGRQRLLKRLKEGENWTALPTHLQKVALGNAFQSWGGRVGFCRRLSSDKPCPTLTTAPNGRATTLCHPTEIRPLSVKEYARLQQFPDDWSFAGSTSQKYVQIGNAVPIGLGRALGACLLKLKARQTKLNKPKGVVVCADAKLAARLAKRSKTSLNPPRMRRIKTLAAARLWMKKKAV